MKKIICILIILFNLVFIIGAINIKYKYYNNVYRIDDIIELGAVSLTMIIPCLFNIKPRILKKHLNNILLVISGIITITIYILFFMFLPKYTVQDAYTIVTSDPRFVSDSINLYIPTRISDKHSNTFAGYGYSFIWEHDKITDVIYFDPIDGEIYTEIH